MQLDPSIVSKDKILTPFDLEQAKQFIGQECYFASSMKRFADNYFKTEGFVFKGILTDVREIGDYPFEMNNKLGGHVYCLPCCFVNDGGTENI